MSFIAWVRACMARCNRRDLIVDILVRREGARCTIHPARIEWEVLGRRRKAAYNNNGYFQHTLSTTCATLHMCFGLKSQSDSSECLIFLVLSAPKVGRSLAFQHSYFHHHNPECHDPTTPHLPLLATAPPQHSSQPSATIFVLPYQVRLRWPCARTCTSYHAHRLYYTVKTGFSHESQSAPLSEPVFRSSLPHGFISSEFLSQSVFSA
jgi:hypothetical protein